MCSSRLGALLHYSDGRLQTTPQGAHRKQRLLAQIPRHKVFSTADRSSFNVVDSAENRTEKQRTPFDAGKISNLNDALFKCNHI